MEQIVRWGTLSTAKIGVNKVIPAMQQSRHCEMLGIASRSEEKARAVAHTLGIPKYYGSYEALIEDEDIGAIYNPLPHHMHYEWTKKCLEAGKHVLCEKPLALDLEEIRSLIEIRDRTGLKVGEAFMVHTHPQWIDATRRIRNGELGTLHSIHGFFSYNLLDPQNFRNKYLHGGGGLWDIGCYPVHTSRMVFGEEPEKVMALFDRDPGWKTDRLTSAILKFPTGQATFSCATQAVPYQRMQFFGDKKMLEIEIPFNAPNDVPCRVFVDDGTLHAPNIREIQYEICDQYTIQGDAFSRAILYEESVPVPLENSLKNTATILALFESENSGAWVSPADML